jgi:hypothetical protein
MARHRTTMTPRERVDAVLRWAVRVVVWLALGALVGLAAYAALAWAGSISGIRVWVAAGVGLLAAAAAGVASTVPGPGVPDEPADGPSAP